MALLVVGLGNPDDAYASTRHNAGFMAVDRVAADAGWRFRRPLFRRFSLTHGEVDGQELFLVKPLTYMNRSGEVLDEVIQRTRCGLKDLLVVCDNMDLPVGELRIKTNGSSAGHNGLASMIEYAGSSEFKRLYIGIGRPAAGSIIDYVLGVPSDEDQLLLGTALDAAAKAIVTMVSQSADRVMNEYNQRKT